MYETLNDFASKKITDEQCQHPICANFLGKQYVFMNENALTHIGELISLYLSEEEKRFYKQQKMIRLPHLKIKLRWPRLTIEGKENLSMNYSIDEKDALAFSSIQGEIFESCIDENKSELDFISRYMKSKFAKSFDDGDYWASYSDKVIIINEISRQSKKKSGKFLNRSILHFIGYFYRYYCYKFNIPSIIAWKELDFQYLYDNYDVLHSFDIGKACDIVKNSNPVSRDTN